MIEQSYQLKEIKVKTENYEVLYHLIFKNALYSMECYIEGSTNKNHHSYIEDITEDEGEAEVFLKLMAKGKVNPVHIKDMAHDYFGK